MEALRTRLRHLAAFDTLGNAHVPTLLLQGETGTGKGLIARAVHESGPRAHGPFIAVNCAAIPETLLEAELFGYAAGAFTDAKGAKPGLFEAASGGTLFLDEIEALPLGLQPKLLTAIEEKRVRRLGAVEMRQVDVKLIAAAQEDLRRLVERGQFRADLYHRLAVVVLDLPPLRARAQDSVLLARHFLQQYATAHGLRPQRLSTAAETWLRRYAWPGNVRELRHLMERATLLHPEAEVDAADLERLIMPLPQQDIPCEHRAGMAPVPFVGEGGEAGEPAGDEPLRLRQALARTGGNVALAARLLGLTRNAVRYRMRRYGITRPQWADLTPSAVPDVLPPSAGAARSPTSTPSQVPLWEQKPVAILAVALTFPRQPADKAVRYDAWTVAARWEQTLEETIQGFAGVVLQRSPTLLVAAFGLPQALEQMPHRAVQAGLAIRHLVTQAELPHRHEPRPTVRLAVHQGPVLVEVAANAPTARWLALEDTLALPMHLLGQARAGELLVSSQVGRQIEALCLVQERALPRDPEETARVAYCVEGLRPAPLPGRVLSRFVGREREIAALHEALAQAERGQGQVVGIMGEPGIGKSRLLYEFRHGLQGQRVTYLEGQCLAYGQTVPYLPVRDLVRQQCGLTEGESPATVVAHVDRTLRRVGIAPEEAPYVLRLLGIQEGTAELTARSPEAIKLHTFAVLRQLHLLASQQQPVILVVENLHWIDTTSEAYFASLVEQLIGARLLLLTTYRPGYRPPWMEKSMATQVALRPLTPHDSHRLIQSVYQCLQEPLPAADRLLAKAEGNPLFLEELVQAALAHPDAPALDVPATIQGVLMARLDRLPEATKRLLQSAAMLGRDVPRWLLETLWNGAGDLDAHLQALQRLEWLYARLDTAEPVYRFKHALTQDVAYASVPHHQRQALHRQAGQALEERYSGRLETALEPLAYHYAQSAESDKAVAYLTRQADRAVHSFAHVEAAMLLQDALTHAVHLATADRERCILELSLRRALSLCFLGRFQEMLDLLLPQREQVERFQDPTLAGPYYFRLGLSCSCLGEYDRAIQYAQRAVAAAQSCGDTLTLGEAYYVLSLAAFSSGRFAEGVTYGQQAVTLLEPTTERHWLAVAQYVLALNYGYLGDFAPALDLATRFEALGVDIEDPQLQTHAAMAVASVAVLQGDGEASLVACQRCLALTPPVFTATLALTVMGQAYLEQAEPAQAIPVLEQVLQRYRQFRFVQGEGRAAALLGEAYLLHGDLVQAQAIAQQGLDVSRAIHYGWGMGMAQRTLGRIALARGDLDEAWEHFQGALQVFTTLQARCEVGRTHLALAELARLQQDHERVHACLREAFESFTTLHVPKYLERTTRLAEACGVLLPALA
jgi:transcriptional regulator with AAA-type ATPase domain/tetratricopeptide (TPR) repeat protein